MCAPIILHEYCIIQNNFAWTCVNIIVHMIFVNSVAQFLYVQYNINKLNY